VVAVPGCVLPSKHAAGVTLPTPSYQFDGPVANKGVENECCIAGAFGARKALIVHVPVFLLRHSPFCCVTIK
jgi:hypothetical protein